MNVDNIKYLFCLFMNHLTSLSCRLDLPYINLASFGRADFFAVKLGSGRSRFLKVSLQTDDERPLKQMFASEKKRGERLGNELWLRKTSS